MATQTKGLPGLYPPYSLIALRRSIGVSMPSQSSSRKSKTCLKIQTSLTEHQATIYYLGSKLIFFFVRKLARCPPFSGVIAFQEPYRQLPLPLPYWECLPTFINQSQQKISKSIQKYSHHFNAKWHFPDNCIFELVAQNFGQSIYQEAGKVI